MHHIVLRHERPEHGLKVAAACCQHSLVCRSGMAIDHESDVTELLANTVEEHLHVLLECSPCESQEPSTTNLQNYVNVTEVSSLLQQ